jgi:hypothetical protein
MLNWLNHEKRANLILIVVRQEVVVVEEEEEVPPEEPLFLEVFQEEDHSEDLPQEDHHHPLLCLSLLAVLLLLLVLEDLPEDLQEASPVVESQSAEELQEVLMLLISLVEILSGEAVVLEEVDLVQTADQENLLILHSMLTTFPSNWRTTT